MDPTEFVTKEEACRMLNCSMTTLDRYVAKGALHRRKIPGRQRVYLHRAEVEKLTQPVVVHEQPAEL